ncbi:MAG: methyltransferase domain-containing protein [Treponema sp.]|nr:methyltransferase domain-containing protein [Treponema sp.]
MASVIIIPAAEQGRGGGHLCRCINLVCNLRALGTEAYLLIPKTSQFDNLFNSMDFNPDFCINDLENRKIKFFILDRFQTPPDELLHYKKTAPVIGIDEGGVSRFDFDFLIDILVPPKMCYPCANVFSPALQFNPSVNQRVKNNNLKILISFGQEDSHGLGLLNAYKLSAVKNKYNLDITFLKGVLSKSQIPLTLKNVKILDTIPNLARYLHEYDLVITHYGITAYEALFAGTTVLLAHPTPYHKKLAKAAGFKNMSMGHLKQIHKRFTTNHEQEIYQKQEIYHEPHEHTRTKTKHPINVRDGSCGSWLKSKDDSGSWSNNSLASLLNNYSPQVNRYCPVCGEEKSGNVSRFHDRTYRRCVKCGIIYMDRTNTPPFEYNKEYFFEQYKKQYGKTYLEDFINIKKNSKHRLKNIKSLLKTQDTQLLDIGCAYGPFLDAAREEGFSPKGIDPAEDAVRYVQQELNIPCHHGFFPNSSIAENKFDVITLWFVIEHFTDCASVLSEIHKLLKPKGILAFCTPSFSGISGKTSLNRFLFASPADHYTIWSPKTAVKALTLAGFKVLKIKVTGHHPKRFTVLAKSKISPLYWLLLAISKLFRLGDAFEIYAQKER